MFGTLATGVPRTSPGAQNSDAWSTWQDALSRRDASRRWAKSLAPNQTSPQVARVAALQCDWSSATDKAQTEHRQTEREREREEQLLRFD